MEPLRPVPVDEMLSHHESTCMAALAIMRAKSNDYARSGDTLANFRACENNGACSTEVGVYVRLTDKISRLANAVNGKDLKVTDESIRDTVLDAINYLVILDKALSLGRTRNLTFEDLQPLPEE